MSTDFRDHVDKFIDSLNNNVPQIYYQSFDFSNVQDSRTKLLQLNYDKNKVSIINLEMIIDLFQLFAAVHNSVSRTSSRDFSVEVPLQLSKTKSVGEALKIFGGFGKALIIAVSILDRADSEQLFDTINKIENVSKMSQEQMEECFKKNSENIQRYYFDVSEDEKNVYDRNSVGEIVSKMIGSKNL